MNRRGITKGTGRGALLLIMLLLLFSSLPVYPDSPLTSTNFSRHYRDIPVVREAGKTGKASGKVLGYLLGESPIDRKAAVVNALGWNIRGQNNAHLYIRGLANRKRVLAEDMTFSIMKPEELFLLGYLLAMDDCFKMKPLKPGRYDLWGADAVAVLKAAADKEPENFTIHFILSLVEAQTLMRGSFCKVYLNVKSVLDRFPSSKRNMRPAAVTLVMKYIKLYRDDCRENEEEELSRLRDRSLSVGGRNGLMILEEKSGR